MFISPEDTAKLKAKVRLLAEAAEREIGPVSTCSISMDHRDEDGRDYSVTITFRPIPINEDTRRTPRSIILWGASPETVVDLARAEIAKRSGDPGPVMDQQTCRPVYPTIAELIEGAS